MRNYQQEAKELVKQISDADREIYTDMVMRSLRGSWRRPQARIAVLELLAEDDQIFDEAIRDEIQELCGIFKDRYFYSDHDGRLFRRTYQDRIDIEYDASTARRLAGFVPDDRTWNERRFARLER